MNMVHATIIIVIRSVSIEWSLSNQHALSIPSQTGETSVYAQVCVLRTNEGAFTNTSSDSENIFCGYIHTYLYTEALTVDQFYVNTINLEPKFVTSQLKLIGTEYSAFGCHEPGFTRNRYAGRITFMKSERMGRKNMYVIISFTWCVQQFRALDRVKLCIT